MTDQRRHPGLHLIPLVALWLVPLVALAIVIPISAAHEDDLLSPDLPVLVTVGEREDFKRTAVVAEVELARAQEVRSQASGVVTALSVISGPVTTGAELMRVNNVPIMAMATGAPLFRDLKVGDDGADVRTLGEFLSSISVLASEDVTDHFGWVLRTAVKTFQSNIGVYADGVFRLSYIAYIPSGVSALAEVEVAVGDQVGAATVLYSATPTPATLTFKPSAEGQTLVDLSRAPVRLQAGPLSVDLTALAPTGEELIAAYDALSQGVASGLLTTTVDSGVELISGALLQLREPLRSGAVSLAAIYVGDSGAQCLFAAEGDTFEAVLLSNVSSAANELGTAYIDAEFVGREVVRDPASLSVNLRTTCR